MAQEADRLELSKSLFRAPDGYGHAWRLSWPGRLSRTRLPGPEKYSPTLAYISLDVPLSDESLARSTWEQHLEGGSIKAYQHDGFRRPLSVDSISLAEAENLARSLREVLNGTREIWEEGQPIERSSAESIARFIEPRVEIVARLTESGKLEIPLSQVEELLAIKVAKTPITPQA